MKLSKQEWLDFWQIILGDNWYLEEDSTFEETEVDNENELPDVITGDATLAWQGDLDKEDYKSSIFPRSEIKNGEASFSTVFRRWKKSLSTVTFIVTMNIEHQDLFKQTCTNVPTVKIIN